MRESLAVLRQPLETLFSECRMPVDPREAVDDGD
jgi:hypothetical protein